MATPDEICRHREVLIKYARRHFRLEPSAAEDLVHDTLLAALSAPQSFRGGNLSGWLYTILKNRFRDQWRKDRRPMPIEVEAVARDAEDELHLAHVLLKMGSLPVKQLRALIAVSIDEITYEAMALIEGVPAGTIKSRVFRARQELARKCDKAA